MIHRAYSVINVKEIREEADFYQIRGIATTPSTDRMNDVVESTGAKFAPSIPLLWQHRHDKPVGLAELGPAGKSGIPFMARLPNVKEPGALKDRVDEAVQSIKYRLIAGVSIGFRVVNDAIESMKNGGLRFKEFEILELSLVTIPANAEATIRTIKQLDSAARAATGHARGGVVLVPGVSGDPATVKRGGIPLIPRGK